MKAIRARKREGVPHRKKTIIQPIQPTPHVNTPPRSPSPNAYTTPLSRRKTKQFIRQKIPALDTYEFATPTQAPTQTSSQAPPQPPSTLSKKELRHLKRNLGEIVGERVEAIEDNLAKSAEKKTEGKEETDVKIHKPIGMDITNIVLDMLPNDGRKNIPIEVRKSLEEYVDIPSTVKTGWVRKFLTGKLKSKKD